MFLLRTFISCLVLSYQCMADVDGDKLYQQWHQTLSPAEKTIFSAKETMSGDNTVHFIKDAEYKGVQCPLNTTLTIRRDGFQLRTLARTKSDVCKAGQYAFERGDFDRKMIPQTLHVVDSTISDSAIDVLLGKEGLVEPYLKEFPGLSKSYFVILLSDPSDISSFSILTKKQFTLFGIDFPSMTDLQFVVEKKKIETIYVRLPKAVNFQNAKCSVINYFQKGMVECTLAADYTTSAGIIPKDSQIRFKTASNRIVVDEKIFYISKLSKKTMLSGHDFLPGEDIKVSLKGATRKFDSKEMGEVTGNRDDD